MSKGRLRLKRYRIQKQRDIVIHTYRPDIVEQLNMSDILIDIACDITITIDSRMLSVQTSQQYRLQISLTIFYRCDIV